MSKITVSNVSINHNLHRISFATAQLTARDGSKANCVMCESKGIENTLFIVEEGKRFVGYTVRGAKWTAVSSARQPQRAFARAAKSVWA